MPGQNQFIKQFEYKSNEKKNACRYLRTYTSEVTDTANRHFGRNTYKTFQSFQMCYTSFFTFRLKL